MIGFNSRESYREAVFDIQTQELARDRLLETRIYQNGRILATLRRSYGDEESVSAVQEQISRQHEEICGRVREGNYTRILSWVSRGIIHLEAREWAKALECFESVLAIDGNDVDVQSYLDVIALRLREDPASRRVLKKDLETELEGLRRNSRHVEADRKQTMLKRLGLETHPPKHTGMQPLARFRQRFLSSPPLRIRLSAYMPSRQLLVASSFLFLVLCVGLIQADTPTRVSTQFHGRVAAEYLKANQVLPARNLYGLLLRQDPAAQDALAGFWDSFRRVGDYPSAIPALLEVVKEERADPWARFCLAEAYRMTSRCEEAIPLYREAIRRGVPESEGTIGWGLCLLEQDRTDKAIRLWEPLHDPEQGDFRIDACLGLAYTQQGMPGRASIHLSNAMRKNPGSPILSLALADSLEAMHQTRKADKLRERAERLLGSVQTHPGVSSPSGEPLSALPGPWDPTGFGTF